MSAKLLELNFKNKLNETVGKTGKKQEETENLKKKKKH